ncbi:hypothetical protein CFR79_01610 [Komagataeibacter saccharivorans]|nr:hypothetical protein CFR79_01610 [Komagataeibacter saccharivorans]
MDFFGFVIPNIWLDSSDFRRIPEPVGVITIVWQEPLHFLKVVRKSDSSSLIRNSGDIPFMSITACSLMFMRSVVHHASAGDCA